MNVGQILETHLGWASSELGDKIKNLLNDFVRKQKNAENIKKSLSHLYNSKEIENEIDKLNQSETLELLKNLSNGIPVATPVFDGASVDDVTKMLEFSGLPQSGQTVLFDGRT
jgi:DNA-directed RNA polymerase subunit beta